MSGLRFLLEELLLFLARSPFGYMIAVGLGLLILFALGALLLWIVDIYYPAHRRPRK